MKLTYAPLWDTLKNKELKKTDLCNLAGLSRNTLAKMGKEEYVALEVVERICPPSHLSILRVWSGAGMSWISQERQEKFLTQNTRLTQY